MRLAAALALSIAAFQPAPAAERVDVMIVFLADVSHSMDEEEVMVVRGSHIAALRHEDVLTALQTTRVAATYVEFAGRSSPLVPWTILDSPEAIKEFEAGIYNADVVSRSYTGIGSALFTATALIERAPFEADRIVIDIAGDGINNISPSVADGRAAALSTGAVINGMPLMIEPSDANLDTYYAENVIGGPGAFSMPLTSLEQMPAALRQKIVQELF